MGKSTISMAIFNSYVSHYHATRRCGARCELHTLGLGSGASTALLLRLARKGGSAQFLADGAPDGREAMGNSTFFGGNPMESIKKGMKIYQLWFHVVLGRFRWVIGKIGRRGFNMFFTMKKRRIIQKLWLVADKKIWKMDV